MTASPRCLVSLLLVVAGCNAILGNESEYRLAETIPDAGSGARANSGDGRAVGAGAGGARVDTPGDAGVGGATGGSSPGSPDAGIPDAGGAPLDAGSEAGPGDAYSCPTDAECCTDADCPDRRACTGTSCSATTCTEGYRYCSGACIEDSNCCTHADCTAPLVCNQGLCADNLCAVDEVPCGGGCIAATACCVDEDCSDHWACDSSVCSTTACATGYVVCGTSCIPADGCCADDDCGGNFACIGNQCSTTTCRPGWERCVSDCIPVGACCVDTDCTDDFACVGNACSTTICRSGYALCDGDCIPNTACCIDADCGGNFACIGNLCSTELCAPGYERCGPDCIPTGDCCTDADCTGNFACVDGACSTTVCARTSCTTTCSMATACRPNYMFVTAELYTLATLGGVSGADAKCQQLAEDASLPGTFKAWVSAGSAEIPDMAARLFSAAGHEPSGWVRPDGRPFINDLAADEVFYPPKVDQHGNVLGPDSGTTDWVLAGGCSGLVYSSDLALKFGRASMGSGRWGEGSGTACNKSFRLYCFGTDYAARLDIQPPPGRKAFLSPGWPVAGGLAGADAHCQQAATNAGLPGTFKAALASRTESLASRFDTSTGSDPWVRVDGVRVVDAAADLFTSGAQSAASLNVTATGAHDRFGVVYTGVGAAGPQSTGLTADTCLDWTSASSGHSAHSGISTGTRNEDALFWQQRSTPCNEAWPIYCLEE